MDYNEYFELLDKLLCDLEKEAEYYKQMYVYFMMLLVVNNITNSSEISEEIGTYVGDLISDNEKEKKIVNLIAKITNKCVLEVSAFFFEGTDEYNLFEIILKRINNSCKKRAMDAYPVLANYTSQLNLNVVNSKQYKALERHKYMSEKEYTDYFEVLKNKINPYFNSLIYFFKVLASGPKIIFS